MKFVAESRPRAEATLAAPGAGDLARGFGFALSFALVFVLVAILASEAALAAQPAAGPSRRPNILLVVTDNTGWGDFGAYGGGILRGAPTPNIDRLAGEGIRLLNFNTEAQCTPSRSALMTGRHAIRSGTYNVPGVGVRYGLIPWETTAAELLRDAGYATGAFGKWHLGDSPGRYPTDQGFEVWYGIANSANESLFHDRDGLARHSIAADAEIPEALRPAILEARAGREPKRIRPFDLDARRRIDGELTERAIAFMRDRARAKTPFFAYVPLTAMHYPTQPHPDFAGRSSHGDYADLLVQTDAYVGRMLDALRELGLERETLVILTADNGPEDPGSGSHEHAGWTGPWAGTYFTAMEGGLRVPFLARWPGRIPAGRASNEIAHLVDLLPTLAAVAGASDRVPTDRPIDGVDLSGFLAGERADSGREGFVVYVSDEPRAVKWRNWKIHFAWQETKYDPVLRYSTTPKVVDLIRDPRETTQVLEPYNTWIGLPLARMLRTWHTSVEANPSVPMGAPDDFVPGAGAASPSP